MGKFTYRIDDAGKSEIHYTRLFKIFQRWILDGSIEKVFENSVLALWGCNRYNGIRLIKNV